MKKSLLPTQALSMATTNGLVEAGVVSEVVDSHVRDTIDADVTSLSSDVTHSRCLARLERMSRVPGRRKLTQRTRSASLEANGIKLQTSIVCLV